MERLKTDGRVVVASSVGIEGVMAVDRIVVADGVRKERTKPLCGVSVACRVVIERLKTKSAVIDPGGQPEKRVCSLSRVGACIAAIRWRIYRSRVLNERKAEEYNGD